MLTEELVLTILGTALRIRFPFVHDRSFGRRMRVADAAPALAPVLNVLPRSIVPELSYLTLQLMPWIDSDVAARLGDIWLLDTLHKKLTRAPWNRPVQYTLPRALKEAGGNGHVHVLDWWEANVGLPHEVIGVLTMACSNRHLQVIEWWTRRKALAQMDESKSQVHSLNKAAMAGHLDVLSLLWQTAERQGCSKSINLHDGYATLAQAVLGDRIDVLEWFLDRFEFGSSRGISVHDLTGALVVAAALGHRLGLQVLLDRFGAACFTPHVAAFACASGDLEFVKWCASKLLSSTTIHSPATYYIASACGHVHILDWLVASNVTVHTFPRADDLQIKPIGWSTLVCECERLCQLAPLLLAAASNDLLSLHPHLCACAAGHVGAVEWWLDLIGVDTDNSKGPRYARVMHEGWAHAADVASTHGQIDMLEWLDAHDGFIVYSHGACYGGLQRATDHGQVAALDWWKAKCELTGAMHVFRNNVSGISLAGAEQDGHNQALVWWYRNRPRSAAATMLDLDVPSIFGIVVTVISDAAMHENGSLLADDGAAEDTALANLPALVANRIPDDLLGACSAHSVAENRVDILDWLLPRKSSFEPLPYGRRALYVEESTLLASAMFDTLMWWMQSGLDLGPLSDRVTEWMEWDNAPGTNTLVLDVCRRVGILTGPIELDLLLRKLDVHVVEWVFKYSQMDVVYTETALECATISGHVDVLEWWKKSGLPVKFWAPVWRANVKMRRRLSGGRHLGCCPMSMRTNESCVHIHTIHQTLYLQYN